MTSSFGWILVLLLSALGMLARVSMSLGAMLLGVAAMDLWAHMLDPSHRDILEFIFDLLDQSHTWSKKEA